MPLLSQSFEAASQPSLPEVEGGFHEQALFDMLDRLDPQHLLASPESRMELFEKATPADAAIALASIHQAIYGDEAAIAPETVAMEAQDQEYPAGFLGVDPEARSELFEHAFVIAQKHAKAGNLKAAGMVSAGTTIALQTFKDGNKRAARAEYAIIANGYSGSQQSKAELSAALSARDVMRSTELLFMPGSSEAIRAFLSEGRPREEQALRAEYWQVGHKEYTPPFSQVMDALEGVSDQVLKKRVAQILHQPGFGLDHVLSRYGEVERVDMPTVFRDYLGHIDDVEADRLVARDQAVKKAYLRRMIDATDNNPVVCFDINGSLRTNTVANISGQDMALYDITQPPNQPEAMIDDDVLISDAQYTEYLETIQSEIAALEAKAHTKSGLSPEEKVALEQLELDKHAIDHASKEGKKQIVFHASEAELKQANPELFAEAPADIRSRVENEVSINAFDDASAKAKLNALPFIPKAPWGIGNSKQIIQFVSEGEPYRIPVDRIIFTNGFLYGGLPPSWAGIKGGQEVTYSDGSNNETSLQLIRRLAKEGSVPDSQAAMSAKVIFGPEGDVYYELDNKEHYVAAAKLRGDVTMPVNSLYLFSRADASLQRTVKTRSQPTLQKREA